MRFLLVGEGLWDWYEGACGRALQSLGHEVVQIRGTEKFHVWREGETEPRHRSLSVRLQHKILAGPAVHDLNDSIVRAADDFGPDVVFCYNALFVYPETLAEVRRRHPAARIVLYSNDDPFGRQKDSFRWRHFKAAIPAADIALVYRPVNMAEFAERGARRIHLMRSYFIKDADYRMEPSPAESRFMSDVVFAGHFEPDGRSEALSALASAGWRVNIFGGGWGRAASRFPPESDLHGRGIIAPVTGEDYRKAISGAKVALCFLSKINRDTCTRRNFQIPAMGTFMLSEFSEDLAGIFAEGEEAAYFRSREELLDKAAFYLKRDSLRESIARKGYERCLRDGHEVTDRMRRLVAWVGAKAGEAGLA